MGENSIDHVHEGSTLVTSFHPFVKGKKRTLKSITFSEAAPFLESSLKD